MTNFTQKEILVEDNAKYSIYQLPNGEFEKRMKYEKLWTKVPETDDDIELYFTIFNERDSELVTPMKNAIGQVFQIANVFFNPYESFDEKTGTNENGVTTTIESVDGVFYATSSKAVYYTLQNMFDVFGTPGTNNARPITVEVTSKRLENGDQINLKLVPRSKVSKAKK